MTNTAIDKKNNQSKLSKSNKFLNDSEDLSISGSEGQKYQKITLFIKGDERKPSIKDENESSQAFPSSGNENKVSPFASSQKEKVSEKAVTDDKSDRSSSVHMLCNNDNHKKPIIQNKISFEKFKENEKRDRSSGKIPLNQSHIEERGMGNTSDLKSPKGDEEKKYKLNNSVFYASLVTKDVNVQDKNGQLHHMPKNYMKVKVPKSPKTPNNADGYYATRGAEINPDDENNTRRRIKKRVPKNLGSDNRQEKQQIFISPENYNQTPTTHQSQSDRRHFKHKRPNNEFIPSDFNHPQVLSSPYYNPYNYPFNQNNINNNDHFIELEIVPEEDSNIDENYPGKYSSGKKKLPRKKPRHIHSYSSSHGKRKRHHRSGSRASRSNRYPNDYDYDSYYDSTDDTYPDQRSTENRRISKKKPESVNSSTQNIDSALDNAERAIEPLPSPTLEQIPTPTQNVGTETNLLRNSSSTQTSFVHNTRATKAVETSSISRNQNNIYDNADEDNENIEENTNENMFNSPKNANVRDRSAAYQNSPGSPSSPRTFNVPRSPHSPRSPPPTYKSDVEGLTNSARKLSKESPILTRGSNLNDNSNEISVNHVPISSGEDDGNCENDLSISSLEKKLNQFKPQSPKDKNAEIEDSSEQRSQQRKDSSPKYLSESNSPSGHGDSNLFDKKENNRSNNDETYEECVLKPSRGSSILSQQKSSDKSHQSLSQLSESQDGFNEEESEENKEPSHVSTKSNHSKPASRNVSAANSSLKGKSSHHSSSFNLNTPSQNQNNSITTESTKQPSLVNEGSSKRGGSSSKVLFNSNMSHGSNKPSSASKSTINIESDIHDFITPDKKSTSSKRTNSRNNSLISEKSHHSNIASTINSPHNSNLGSSIHSPHNSKIENSIHSVHNSNGTNSYVSQASANQNPSLISNNSASTFLGDKGQAQFSEAFDHLSEITTSDVSDRFIKKRGFEMDSIIDSSFTNNSEISIGSNASAKDRNGSVLVEEIEEEEVEEEIEYSQAHTRDDSTFSNLFDVSAKHSNESSEFNLFSSQDSGIKSRRVNKRLIDPSEHYMKLSLQVLETKTRDPRVTEVETENPALSNSIHDVQIEPAVPTESKLLFVQIGFKDQDTILSTPTRNCKKLDDPISKDEAFSTAWESNYLVTGFENSAILFTLCRTEFSGFKKLASVHIQLSTFKELSDEWFDLIPENDEDEINKSAYTPPNSPSTRSVTYGKIHIVTNIESSISLPPFDIEKQVEIIASKDQIKLDNRNQEEIERIKAISLELSSGSNSSSIHESDDFETQKKKLARKFNNFKGQFSSISDVSAAYMNSENADSDGHRIRQRKIGGSRSSSKNNLLDDDNKFNSSSSMSKRRKKDNHNHDEPLNEMQSFNSASSTSRRRRIKVPKNSNHNIQQKTDSGIDDLNLSAHSSSHGGSRTNKKDKKLSSASEGQDFAFEKISSSSGKKKQNQSQNQGSPQSKSSDIDNYFKDVSSTVPETITFDNTSTAVGVSNFTLSGFQSPQKGNQNKKVTAPTSNDNNNNNNNFDDDDDDEIEFKPVSYFSENSNSDAPTNSIDLAEVKKEKTLSRDPPKRTHVSNFNNKQIDDDDSLMDMINSGDSC